RIRGSQRHLDRVRIDFGGEADRLLDRFFGLTRESEDERAVNGDAEVVTVLGEAAGELDPHALLDVVQNLLIAGFVADEQQAQAVVPEHLERGPRNVWLGIARPGDPQ